MTSGNGQYDYVASILCSVYQQLYKPIQEDFMSTLVQVNNLAKKYDEGGVLAVDDISFEIKDGEVFSLLGPNGAG